MRLDLIEHVGLCGVVGVECGADEEEQCGDGNVDQGETFQTAAARECMEESGYIVEVGPVLRAINVEQGDATNRFTFFVATMTDEVEEYETFRQRKWIPRTLL